MTHSCADNSMLFVENKQEKDTIVDEHFERRKLKVIAGKMMVRVLEKRITVG